MTVIQLRTAPDQPIDRAADLLLDWFGRRASSTVHQAGNLIGGLRPPATARDLLHLGGAVFCVDKLVLRADTADGWTRDPELRATVSDVDAWTGAAQPLRAALEFLTGDHWTLRFIADPDRPDRLDGLLPPDIDAVTLFSGGLDSLAGTIDLLTEADRVVLVGHHESPLTAATQTTLSRALRVHHGQTRVRLRQLFLRPASPSRRQARRSRQASARQARADARCCSSPPASRWPAPSTRPARCMSPKTASSASTCRSAPPGRGLRAPARPIRISWPSCGRSSTPSGCLTRSSTRTGWRPRAKRSPPHATRISFKNVFHNALRRRQQRIEQASTSSAVWISGRRS